VTGAQILTAFQAIGATVQLTPAGIVDVSSPDVPELERLVAEVKANRSEVVEELKRHAAPLVFDPERSRRLEERRQRTLTALAERYCPACGFSFWRVSPRGDPDCYGCTLLREEKPLRCAACGAEKWRRDSAGRRVCSTCHEGDSRGAAPVEIASPEPTSREFSAPRGAT
jgi:dGTP triphosphohydrolase